MKSQIQRKLLALSAFLFLSLCSMAQWTTLTDVNTIVSDEKTSDIQSIGTSDGKTWVVFWKEVPAPQYYEVRAQLLDDDGSRLLGPNGMLVNNVVPMSTWTAIWSVALGKEDELYVGFNGTGASNDAYVHKISTTGVQLWGNNGIVVGVGFDVKIFPLSNGEAIVHWLPGNEGMMQKYNASGQAVWTSPVTINPLVQGHGTSAGEMSELSNGDFVILIHDRAGFGINSVLHAQRYTTLGATVWTAQVPIANASTVFNRRYTLVQDFDTLYLGYTVSPGMDFQSYLQRINPDGTLPWGINGSDFATQTTYYEMNTKAAFSPGSDYIWAICEFTNTAQSETGEYVQKFDKQSGARQLSNNAKLVFPVSPDMQSHKGDLQLYNDKPFFVTSLGYNNSASPIDLVATLLDANGDFAWPDSTRDVATSLESKFRYSFTTPVDGQSVCVWVEERDAIGESRAFAQNVLADDCPPPVASFTYNLNGLVINLNCNTPDADSIFWFLSDNTQGMGSSFTHTFATTGTYIISLVVKNECGSDEIIDTIYITSIGIDDADSFVKLLLYPNPVIHDLNLDLTPAFAANFSCCILTMTGQIVYQHPETRIDGSYRIIAPRSIFQPGTYILSYQYGSKSGTRKIIITY